MTSEVQFLESHLARTEALRQRRSSRHRDDDDMRVSFWDAFRMQQSHWKQRLNELLVRYGQIALHAEIEKREALLEIHQLNLELKTLRRVCLLGSTENIIEAADNKNNDNNTYTSSSNGQEEQCPAVVVPTELPLGDLRILYAEFCKSQEQLDQIQAILLPRGKFVFRRYREAWQQQQQQHIHSLNSSCDSNGKRQIAKENSGLPVHLPISNTTTTATSTRTITKINDIQSLEGIHGASVVVDPNGQAIITSTTTTANEDKCTTISVPSSTPILQTIENCTIVLKGSYHAVYLRSVTNSTIHIVHPVDGPVHVTNCHNVILRLHQSQQLRLHESSDLSCSVRVSAGAILEDCRRIVFYTSDTSSKALDVKDFNWMKQHVPSPNYIIEYEEEETPNEGNTCHGTATSMHPVLSVSDNTRTCQVDQSQNQPVVETEVSKPEQIEDDEL